MAVRTICYGRHALDVIIDGSPVNREIRRASLRIRRRNDEGGDRSCCAFRAHSVGEMIGGVAATVAG